LIFDHLDEDMKGLVPITFLRRRLGLLDSKYDVCLENISFEVTELKSPTFIKKKRNKDIIKIIT